jgi:MFS family permease
MFGSMIFVPLFIQVVKGVSPTESGLRLFPLMLGVFITSVGSGQIVSKWGKYKIFPILGTSMMAIGAYLMAFLHPTTSFLMMAFYMFVLGAGIGLVMSIPVLAVQNAVPYEELGAATSNCSFFRLIGSCFGTAAYGAIFSNFFAKNLSKALPHVPIPKNVVQSFDNPTKLRTLPSALHHGVVVGIAHTIDQVMIIGIPVSLLALVLAFILPEVPLRTSIRATSTKEGMGIATGRTSLAEMELALSALSERDTRRELYRGLAERAGLSLSPQSVWMLLRIDERQRTPGSVQGFFDDHTHPTLRDAKDELLSTKMVDAATVTLTERGIDAAAALRGARRERLAALLEGWDVEHQPEIQDLIRRLASELYADDEALLTDAKAGALASSHGPMQGID